MEEVGTRSLSVSLSTPAVPDQGKHSFYETQKAELET